MTFKKRDMDLKRCIRYIKFLLFFLAFVSIFSSLAYNNGNLRNYNKIREIESSSAFKVAQNTIENFYSGVQNEISLVNFIAGHGAPTDTNIQYLDTILQYGGFMFLSDTGKVTEYETGPQLVETVKDDKLGVIKNVTLNNALVHHCVRHQDNHNNYDVGRGRILYHLPLSSLSRKLADALSKIGEQDNFSIVDKNYNEIYQSSKAAGKANLKKCGSIYSSFDSGFHFCQEDLSSIPYKESIIGVFSFLLPLSVALVILSFLNRVELALMNSKAVETSNGNINPLLADRTPSSCSNFISCITHELRTPLNVIIAFSEMIKDECLGSINNKRYVCYGKEIFDFGTNLLKTVDNIIDVTKSNSMLLTPNRDSSSIQKILGEVVRSCRSIILEKEIELSKDIDPLLPEIFIDHNQVKKAITNILSNAVKFSPNGATVSIEASHDPIDDSIHIVIEDSGIGMTIVEGMPTPEKSLTQKADGLGIGLLLSRNIIRLNNGNLEIYSQVGKGTRSVITFYRQKNAGLENTSQESQNETSRVN
ncbi:his Kinase A domain protein [Neorickettsia helminthoeca str. Oregon]|uniref:histidine kinase n=1 Tax=Neorickettsia helminthoeca str. Oregon TaxID=1286528 RepID=X5H4F9_9RICK|nr:HAMP domain-containing sensor histidine kinase [Neorickettsia helminthoeca]AHX11451.1 his Kinase A domain protein [Neorickettsia helminthoeca str. Oregon]